MKRFLVLCLGIGAALTITGAVASSAQAEPPEFGRCLKVAKATGKYSSGKCIGNVIGSKTESDFEWFPGPGAMNKYTASGGLATLFETHEGYSGTCTSSTAHGEYVGSSDNKHLTVEFVYVGCKVVSSPGGAINGASCQTEAHGSGEVITNPLLAEVGWLNKAEKKTAALFAPKAEFGNAYTPEFLCGSYRFQVVANHGALVKIANDAMKLEYILKFKQSHGTQIPSVWHIGESGQQAEFVELLIEGFDAFGKSGFGFESRLKGEEKLELNAVV